MQREIPRAFPLHVSGARQSACCVKKCKHVIVKKLKPTVTPYYFRRNCATLLFESGVELLIAMKMRRHTYYQITNLKSKRMKRSRVDIEAAFRGKKEDKGALAKAQTSRDKRSWKTVLNTSSPWAGKF